MRVVELARTLQDRPVNMFIIGYPTPPATAQAISDMPSLAINCNVHGNEASGRESCFTMARQLALSTDPAITDMLSRMTVLIVPSINADGRLLNQRGNTTGQDLNRDHALIEQNETKGLARMIRDYTPDVMLDNHEGDSEDLPILGARHLNVYEGLFEENKYMVNNWMYGAAAQSGWWMGPYSTGGDSHEGILRNTGGLKNGISMLGEARAGTGGTRPAEGTGNNPPANRLRKVYAHLWENWETMRYFAGRMTQVRDADRRVGRVPDGQQHRPDRPARLLPVAVGPERRRGLQRARRRHAAGVADPRSRRRAATSSPSPSTRLRGWTPTTPR